MGEQAIAVACQPQRETGVYRSDRDTILYTTGRETVEYRGDRDYNDIQRAEKQWNTEVTEIQ